MTVDQFLQMDEVEGEKTELINGEPTSMPKTSGPHETVKANIIELLVCWAAETKLFKVYVESGYQVDEQNYLIPDISLIARQRVGTDPELGDRAPELAIEVVSSETAARLEDKITLYLRYGSHAVWVLYSRQRAIRVYDKSGNARRLTTATRSKISPSCPDSARPSPPFSNRYNRTPLRQSRARPRLRNTIPILARFQ